MIFCHLMVVLSDRMVTATGLHLIIYIGEAAEESRAVALGLRADCAWGKRLAKDAQGCTQ